MTWPVSWPRQETGFSRQGPYRWRSECAWAPTAQAPVQSERVLHDCRLVRFLSSERETLMSTKSPWHSILSGVHHNNTNCNTGNNIEKENLRAGTGGKPLCQECADLNRRGK
jgi:hypothetical protein